MAIRGLSQAERKPYILRQDKGHPDNIEKEVERRASKKIGGKVKKITDDMRNSILKEIQSNSEFHPTIFYIGNLTRADRVYLGDLTTSPVLKDGGMFMVSRKAERALETVSRGLVGWDNFLDEAGNAIPFAKDGDTVSDDALSKMPMSVVYELAEAIETANGVSDDLEKNLEGASQLPDALRSVLGDAQIAQKNSKQ